jgi:hypothetical protein
LKKPGEDIKDLFRGLVHRERMMRRVSMKEESLEEKREVPVGNKK